MPSSARSAGAEIGRVGNGPYKCRCALQDMGVPLGTPLGESLFFEILVGLSREQERHDPEFAIRADASSPKLSRK